MCHSFFVEQSDGDDDDADEDDVGGAGEDNDAGVRVGGCPPILVGKMADSSVVTQVNVSQIEASIFIRTSLKPSKEIELATRKITMTFLIFELFQGLLFLQSKKCSFGE